MRNLFILTVFLSLLSVSCQRKVAKDKAEENRIITAQYSRADTLQILADSLQKYISAHLEWNPHAVRYGYEDLLTTPTINFVLDWKVETDSLMVWLAVNTEEITGRFREEILDSPLIHFRKSSPRIPFAEHYFSDYKDGASYGYELQLSQDSFTLPLPSTLTATIYNHTDTDATTGSRYSIDYKNNGSWEVIEFQFNHGGMIGFPDIGYSLLSHSKHAYTIQLYPDLYDYQPGEYRIRRSFMIDGHYTQKGHSRIWENYNVAAPFTIR